MHVLEGLIIQLMLHVVWKISSKWCVTFFGNVQFWSFCEIDLFKMAHSSYSSGRWPILTNGKCPWWYLHCICLNHRLIMMSWHSHARQNYSNFRDVAKKNHSRFINKPASCFGLSAPLKLASGICVLLKFKLVMRSLPNSDIFKKLALSDIPESFDCYIQDDILHP